MYVINLIKSALIIFYELVPWKRRIQVTHLQIEM